VTGLSLLLLLVKNGVDPATITLIDPHFDGGDLARKWGPVRSNTPWSKTVFALRRQGISPDIPDLSGTTTLSEIADLFRRLTDPIPCKRITGFVTSAHYTSDTDQWSLSCESVLQAKSIFITCGSDPKILDLPLPSIPLECALDLNRLKTRINPTTDSIVLFGTMHSGTLVMKNLNALSVKTTAFYTGSTPFIWDRDGAYDGIKEEAAHIADDIVAGRYVSITLAPVSDTSTLIRSTTNATHAIYAMGFAPRPLRITVDGTTVDSTTYSGTTGALTHAPRAWGFGIAYPNLAPDGLHWDVSVAAFLNHIEVQLPILLQALR
jgi:hypothetical protein